MTGIGPRVLVVQLGPNAVGAIEHLPSPAPVGRHYSRTFIEQAHENARRLHGGRLTVAYCYLGVVGVTGGVGAGIAGAGAGVVTVGVLVTGAVW